MNFFIFLNFWNTFHKDKNKLINKNPIPLIISSLQSKAQSLTCVKCKRSNFAQELGIKSCLGPPRGLSQRCSQFKRVIGHRDLFWTWTGKKINIYVFARSKGSLLKNKHCIHCLCPLLSYFSTVFMHLFDNDIHIHIYTHVYFTEMLTKVQPGREKEEKKPPPSTGQQSIESNVFVFNTCNQRK